MSRKNGFTMVEMLISSGIIAVVMAGVLMLSLHGQKTHMTENIRGDMFQNLRFLKHLFTEKIRSAGSGLSQINLPNINRGIKDVYFLGVYPLNNATFPDGIILASADPNVYAEVSEGNTFNPGTSVIQLVTYDSSYTTGVQESIQTRDTTNPVTPEPEWKANDIGMVVCNDGYFIFKVLEEPAIGDTSLVIRPQAVYYSGQLSTAHYHDNYHLLNGSGQTGAQLNYDAGSPIWKLDYFHIYMVTEDPTSGDRTLTLTTDTHGVTDPLDPENATMDTAVPIADNIIDLQFEYVARNTVTVGQYEYWCSLAPIDFYGNTVTSYDAPCSEDPLTLDALCQSFYDLFKQAAIRSIIVNISVRTEEMGYKQGEAPEYTKPVMGDSGSAPYQTRHYYRDIRFEVLLRNFSYQTFYK